MAAETNQEVLGFQAEVTQLLDIMIHSIYSNKEIFLRELISNASDAIDRLRFAMLADPALVENDPDFKIRVNYDKDQRTITISDNGIGMSRAEVIEHIGTIAKSGTREFLQSLTGDQQKDARLIGQFGVGFYSAFVVADKVTLNTRRAGAAEQGVRWESEGKGQYTLETIDKPARGTEIILHLREGEDEFLEGYRLRSIIRKYSDHISIPIYMPAEGKDASGEEAVNRASALWTRSKSEVSEEEYKEFYKYISHDFDEPLAYLHSRMEGTHEYTMLLYIPKHAPFDLWSMERQKGIKLYVRRVYILEDTERLMPRYLRFIRGVIDSSDLPLNISRELLQQNRMIDSIRSNAVKKVLGLLTDMAAQEKEKYETFWQTFGRVLKEGITEDASNRETLAPLLRFATTRTGNEEQSVSLDDYIARMKQGQDKIYYITAESYAAAKASPLLEVFNKKDIEVLLLYEPVDTLLVTELQNYKDIALQSVAKGTIDLSQLEDEKEKEERQEKTNELQDLLNRLKDTLNEQVREVRITTRLTTSPACLVVDENDIDPTLQRLLKASGHAAPTAKPILEINAEHPLINKMKDEQDGQKFTDLALVLFDQSMLSRGEQLEDPIRFVNRLNTLLMQL
ncbi:molecular chaperone HtpG [Ktedonosporobacter rubrisoli]|uniref:Chaperone protein HtpG n=1 Tax=Ktedonosporobacter rubrisoli TaxID=2509675 RepID=A0A4P6K2P2_KTERU|nr:molecular chaperone HtpG [Ktedonosporobacter rubrisoli]QBD82182.1 molecular chaperone HtpG [Ktedonosporobacter rubrisoli]